MDKIIVSDAKYQELLELVGDNQGIVIVRKSIANNVGLDENNISDVSYDFGGDADIWIDFVGHEQHYFIEEAREQEVIK